MEGATVAFVVVNHMPVLFVGEGGLFIHLILYISWDGGAQDLSASDGTEDVAFGHFVVELSGILFARLWGDVLTKKLGGKESHGLVEVEGSDIG